MKTDKLSDNEDYGYDVTDRKTGQLVGRGFYADEESAQEAANAHGDAVVSQLLMHENMHISPDGSLHVWDDRYEDAQDLENEY